MTRPYRVVAAVTLVPVLAVLAVTAVRPQILAVGRATTVEDFGAYWTAAVVNLRGGNAYVPANLAPLQAEIEPGRPEPLPAWSPPWTSAALAPLTPLPFAAARWVWLFVQLGTVLAAVTGLWRLYGGPPDRLATAWAAALLWYPTLQTLGLGQHSSLVLLGVAGWVCCLAAGRPVLAGLFLGLVLVKPQNLHLLGLLVAVWAIDKRAWSFAAGGAATAVVLTAGAVLPNPEVFAQYSEALANRPPSQMVTPTVGTLLRVAFGPDRFWLAFVPAVAAAAWGVWYYARNRARWEWPERLTVVLFVSYLASPYGWVYDQVLFLVPLTQVLALAARHRSRWLTPALVVVAVLTGVCLAMNAVGFQEAAFVWFAPLGLGLYLGAMSRVTSRTGP